MSMFWLSLAVIVVSNVIYHVGQKSIPGGTHPILSVLVTYAVAIVATLLLLPFFPLKGSLGQGLRQLRWPTYLVGLSIVGIEVGFLLAYRAGWRIGVASTTVAAALVVVLIPLGIAFYGERLSGANVAGLLLCVAGLVLVAQR